MQTGNVVHKVTDSLNLEHVLKASSAVPLFYRGYPEVDGFPMTDGGVADAIPVTEAIRRGASRIMVIRSRHQDYRKQSGLADYFMSWYLRSHPFLKQAMAKRVQRYNETVTLIRKPPDGIAIVEICPPQNFRVSRLSQDRLILQEGYDQGRSLAGEAIARWSTK